MVPFFTEHFGNASSTTHQYGWEAEAAVKQARVLIAEGLNATPEEIVFTSGATEANNLAIKGVAEAYFNEGRHIVTVQTEHSAVLDPCAYLETLGFEVTYLSVNPDGLIDLEQLMRSLRTDTILVSVMAANNEIGVLQPLAAIGQLCRDRGILFHTDAAQAIGKVAIDVQAQCIDLLSITGHKIYGPKGIGALYVRRRQPRVKLAPQLHGGGHERGMRSGTLYTPQIMGLSKALELAWAEQETEQQRLKNLRDRLWHCLKDLPGIHLNGHPTQRLTNNLNISIDGIDGQALLLGLKNVVAVSSGAACSSTKTAPSHVLKALGHSNELAYTSLRFGLGRFNTPEEITHVAQICRETVLALQGTHVAGTGML